MARPTIKVRKRLFVGCEGDSEVALMATLQELANDHGWNIHLDKHNCRGGNALSVVTTAIKKRLRQLLQRDPFDGGSFVIMDKDRYDADGDAQQINALVKAEKIVLILQDDNFEAHLGRILSGQPALGAHQASKHLKGVWSDYDKPPSSAALKTRLNAPLLRQSTSISPEWQKFMNALNIS